MITKRERAIAPKCQLLVGSYDGGENGVCECLTPNVCPISEESRKELIDDTRVIEVREKRLERFRELQSK